MVTAEEILNRLNDEQKEAVKNYVGPSFIVAGPGAGKTFTVISRTQYMILNGVQPEKILLFTFTNKAAREIKERIARAVGEDVASQITTGTYHSFCCKLLRQYANKIGFTKSFSILDSEDSDKVLKKLCKGTNVDPKRLKSYISKQKRNLVTPAKASMDRNDNYAMYYDAYQKELMKENAMDFDDLIFNTIRLLQTHPEVLIMVNARWQWITADEYHDSAGSDIKLIQLLAGRKQNACFILDNDQSIYSFRGADLDAVLRTQTIFKDLKIFNLNQNYRCSETIVEASKSLIAHNPVTIKKNIFTTNPKGGKILLYDEKDAAQEGLRVAKSIQVLNKKYKTDYRDIAILFRTNKQSRAIEDALLKYKIPYEILSGINFYARKEIKDILAFMKFIINPFDLISFQRIVNIPKRGIGDASIEKIVDESRNHIPPISLLEACTSVKKLRNPAKDNIKEFYNLIEELRAEKDNLTVPEFIQLIIIKTCYYDYLEADDPESYDDRVQNIFELIDLAHDFLSIEEMLEQTSLDRKEDEDGDNKVQLMTMHMSKGLEYPVVFLVGCNEGTTPHFNSIGSAKAIEEERRLFYVGMTRAKQLLILTRFQFARHQGGGWMKTEASRFLSEIDEQYIHSHKDSK